MFGAPVRDAQAYKIAVNVNPLGVRLRMNTDSKIMSDFSVQHKFAALQRQVLSELVKERSLFRNAPTLDSLEAITPNWGFIRISDGEAKLSPYTTLDASAIVGKIPCMVDLQLVELKISRSTIAPCFKVLYVCPAPVESHTVIDFDFDAAEGAECIEVSDVPATDGVVHLVDPAQREREKAIMKAQVRAAFTEAQVAREKAEDMAHAFLEKYDLSDAESAFTEWEEDETDVTDA